MKRREFIIKSSGILGLPLIIQQIGCDGDYDYDSSEDGLDEDSFSTEVVRLGRLTYPPSDE